MERPAQGRRTEFTTLGTKRTSSSCIVLSRGDSCGVPPGPQGAASLAPQLEQLGSNGGGWGPCSRVQRSVVSPPTPAQLSSMGGGQTDWPCMGAVAPILCVGLTLFFHAPTHTGLFLHVQGHKEAEAWSAGEKEEHDAHGKQGCGLWGGKETTHNHNHDPTHVPLPYIQPPGQPTAPE